MGPLSPFSSACSCFTCMDNSMRSQASHHHNLHAYAGGDIWRAIDASGDGVRRCCAHGRFRAAFWLRACRLHPAPWPGSASAAPAAPSRQWACCSVHKSGIMRRRRAAARRAGQSCVYVLPRPAALLLCAFAQNRCWTLCGVAACSLLQQQLQQKSSALDCRSTLSTGVVKCSCTGAMRVSNTLPGERLADLLPPFHT